VPRSRNIKPAFFNNEDLAECQPFARLCFIGLWTLADREGRLQDRPKRIKGELFAYDTFEVEPLLVELEKWGFIRRYQVEGESFIHIVNFLKHQTPHGTEKDGKSPDENGRITVHKRGKNGYATGDYQHELHALTVKTAPPALACNGALTVEDLRLEGGENALIPDSGFLNPDSLIPEKITRKARTPSKEISLSEYLEQCKAENRKAVPPEHPIHVYAADAGITTEMLQVAWLVFKDRHFDNATAKKYIDWPKTFGNSVKSRWYRLWYPTADGQADWSKEGLQERRVLEVRMSNAMEQEADHAPA
jgi:hypothetical protein